MHHVLMPMVGALHAGLAGVARLVVGVRRAGRRTKGRSAPASGRSQSTSPRTTRIERLRAAPAANLLDDEWEIPLFMAWWDLVGQVLGKPLHAALGGALRRGLRAALARAAGRLFVAALPRCRGPRRRDVRELAAVRGPAGRGGLLDAQALDDELRARRLRRARGAHPRGDPARGRHPHRRARHVERDRGAPHHAGARALPRLLYRAAVRLAAAAALLRGRAPCPSGRAAASSASTTSASSRSCARDTAMPISCHWWTPPIVQPAGVSRAADAWEFDWYLIERYDPVDISVPDIGLGVFGLWRLFQMTRFMGLHLQIHSNSELGLQQSMRGAMFAALGYYPESRGPLPRHDAAALRADGHRVQPGARRRPRGRQAAAAGRARRAVAGAGPRPQRSIPSASSATAGRRSAPARFASRRPRSRSTTCSTARAGARCPAGPSRPARSASTARPIPTT